MNKWIDESTHTSSLLDLIMDSNLEDSPYWPSCTLWGGSEIAKRCDMIRCDKISYIIRFWWRYTSVLRVVMPVCVGFFSEFQYSMAISGTFFGLHSRGYIRYTFKIWPNIWYLHFRILKFPLIFVDFVWGYPGPALRRELAWAVPVMIWCFWTSPNIDIHHKHGELWEIIKNNGLYSGYTVYHWHKWDYDVLWPRLYMANMGNISISNKTHSFPAAQTIFHLLRVQPVPHLVPGLRGLRAHPQRGEITDLSELPSGNLTYQ